MAWNPPPPRQATDPWGDSFASTSTASAWPATNNANSQYSSQPSQQQPWPSTTSGATSSYPASSAWPTTTSAPQWPSAAQPSTSSAWPQPQQAQPSSAWPGSPPAAASSQPWTTTAAPAVPRYPAAPAPTSSWPAANTSTATQWPSDPWGTSTASAPLNQSWGGNTSGLNQSATSSWGAPGMSRPAPQQQQPNPFTYGTDPFAPANNSYTSQSQQQAAFNPFDVTNDDAGFFASKPSTKPQPQPQRTSSAPTPKDSGPAPSATAQRLMRVASMLFERGLLIKADKLVIQEMVLRGEKKAEKALESAELDGNVQPVQEAILAERKREEKRKAGEDTDSQSEDEDVRAEAAATSFKKRPSIARKNSDDDDDQTENISDFRRQGSTVGKGGVDAPHPAAGGYTGTIPPEMSVQKGQFVGSILMRISSKKMFRKWKPVFFALDLPRLTIFENRREWEMGSAPKFVLPLHECMWIAKPTLKKTYSLIDDGRRVYYSTLKENAPSIVAQAAMAGMERPTNFSPALESRVVAKFGSYYPDEISAFAHAIYSVVLVHQKETKSSLASGSSRSVMRETSFKGGRAGNSYGY